jgi:ABC-type protease/lipase transport system fused ATPase/permease subunit
MGAPFADDSAILAAAELAGVQEFANTHPEGFDMPIGERGESSPAASARPWRSPARCSTTRRCCSSTSPQQADHQSEEGLKQRLRGFASHKTIILVTHRTSLLDLVDRLIVLDQGRSSPTARRPRWSKRSSMAASGARVSHETRPRLPPPRLRRAFTSAHPVASTASSTVSSAKSTTTPTTSPTPSGRWPSKSCAAAA